MKSSFYRSLSPLVGSMSLLLFPRSDLEPILYGIPGPFMLPSLGCSRMNVLNHPYSKKGLLRTNEDAEKHLSIESPSFDKHSPAATLLRPIEVA